MFDFQRAAATDEEWNLLIDTLTPLVDAYSSEEIGFYWDDSVFRMTLFNVDQSTCDELQAALAPLADPDLYLGYWTIELGCITAGLPATQVKQTFIGSEDLESGWFWNEWMNYFYGEQFPFVWPDTYNTGWLYVIGDSASFYIYNFDLGAWLWSNQELWPQYFNFLDGQWQSAPEN